MKTNYRRRRTKARQDRGPNYRGLLGQLKRDSKRLERRVPLPNEDDEDERPRSHIFYWHYF
jgi:hypothetical protein